MSMFTGNSTILALPALLLFHVPHGQSEEYFKLLLHFIAALVFRCAEPFKKRVWELLGRFLVNV